MHTDLKKRPVMVLHWVHRESNYAVCNCKPRSIFEACCISCKSVASRGCACCVPALSDDIDHCFYAFGMRVMCRC